MSESFAVAIGLQKYQQPTITGVNYAHDDAKAVPRTLRRNMLVLSIAWQIQAKVLGGLKPATRKHLRQVAEAARTGVPVRPIANNQIKPGTKLIRVWQDKTHTVTALSQGFDWQGKRYRSLSQIARLMTGTRWNGLVFFGVKTKASPSKPVAATKAARREAANV